MDQILMPQSLSKIYVHVVFSTKYRKELILDNVIQELHHYTAGILNNMECPSIQVGGVKDHIHILFVLSRTNTIAQIVEKVKTGTSKWIKTKGDGYKGFHWQSGYSAFSVSQSGIIQVTEYIQNQAQHHLKMTFQEEYRSLLLKYKISFNEEYVWD
jgi:REP element-mobilizing transposase RayT